MLVLAVLTVAGGTAPVRAAAGSERRPARKQAWPVGTVPGSLLVTTAAGEVEAVRVAPGTEAAAAARLSARPDVEAVEPDHVRQAFRTPAPGNDPLYPEQWAHGLSRAEAAWDITTGDPNVQVAVIDSGIDATHPGLSGNVVRQVDVSTGDVEERPLGIDNDACGVGHGTFVAGVLGAVGDDANDVAGLAWRVGIVDVAAADPFRCGSFSDSAIIAAISFATAAGVDVINLSLGGPSDACPTAFQTVLDAARAQGIVVVAAAGNEERQFPGITSVPASCRGVISVGAVGETGAHAGYSNANAHVDLAAPGGDLRSGRGILSTARGGGAAFQEGTSFAAPYVAAAAALLRSVKPNLTADQVEALLEQSAAGTSGTRTPRLGWGRVDVAAALTRAVAGQAPSPAPDPAFPIGLVGRISAQEPKTDAVKQAVAVSRFVFASPDTAQHAVLARRDDFADALAGSALGFGVGPILFSGRTGPLDPTTAAELDRILPPKGRVYLLGGTAALPATLEAELRSRDLTPVRLAGATRHATAVRVAEEVMVRVAQLGFDAPTRVILATSRQWPDAVAAGSLAAWFGYPILLTDPDALPASTRDELAKLRPERLYVVGGTTAVSEAVLRAAAAAAAEPEVGRLAGVDRSGTAVQVGRQFVEDLLVDTGEGPLFAIGVNLRRSDGFTHVLSASTIAGAGAGVYLPIEGDRGDNVPGAVVPFACSINPVRGLVAGDADVVNEPAKVRLNSLLEHTAPDCK